MEDDGNMSNNETTDVLLLFGDVDLLGPVPNYLSVVFIINNILIFVFGVIGNVIIFIIYWRTKPKNPCDWFILFIANMDLIVCSGHPWLNLRTEFAWGGMDAIACFLECLFTFTAMLSSCFLMGLMAFERYIKVCRPTVASLTGDTAKILCFGAVLLAFAICIYPSTVFLQQSHCEYVVYGSGVQKIYMICLFCIFCACFIIVTLSYTFVIMTIEKKIKVKRRLLQNDGLHSHDKGGKNKEKSCLEASKINCVNFFCKRGKNRSPEGGHDSKNIEIDTEANNGKQTKSIYDGKVGGVGNSDEKEAINSHDQGAPNCNEKDQKVDPNNDLVSIRSNSENVVSSQNKPNQIHERNVLSETENESSLPTNDQEFREFPNNENGEPVPLPCHENLYGLLPKIEISDTTGNEKVPSIDRHAEMETRLPEAVDDLHDSTGNSTQSQMEANQLPNESQFPLESSHQREQGHLLTNDVEGHHGKPTDMTNPNTELDDAEILADAPTPSGQINDFDAVSPSNNEIICEIKTDSEKENLISQQNSPSLETDTEENEPARQTSSRKPENTTTTKSDLTHQNSIRSNNTGQNLCAEDFEGIEDELYSDVQPVSFFLRRAKEKMNNLQEKLIHTKYTLSFNHKQKRWMKERRMTFMLFCITFTFLASWIPAWAFHLCLRFDYKPFESHEAIRVVYRYWEKMTLIQYCSNFLYYLVFNPGFRKKVKALLKELFCGCKRCHKKGEGVSVVQPADV